MLAKVKLLGHIRRWFLAGVIFFAASILAVNVQTLAQEKGWDLWLSGFWGPAMSKLAWLLDQGLFWASFWFVCGATAVTWVAYFLARDRSPPDDVLNKGITALDAWVPIREAFEQIANHLGFFGTGEADQEQVYSEVAKVIQQAVKTAGIKLRGNEHTDGTLSQYPYTKPKKLVPENYWDAMEIDWRGVIINQPDTGHTSLDDALIYEGNIKELPQYYNVDIWREDLNYHWPIKGTRHKRESVKQTTESPLSDPEPSLHTAALWAIYESAWGKWQRDQHSGVSEDHFLQSVMVMVAHIVMDAAVSGKLEIKGRPPDRIEFQPISKATWRLAGLSVVPDKAAIFKFEVIPRGIVVGTDKKLGPSHDRIKDVLNYDSLIVNFEQFQFVFDAMGR